MKEKSKQNITRDTEIKNNLTIVRGEWGGTGEGFSGTTIKNTWKKTRERVEAWEGGGIGWGGGELSLIHI